MSTTALQTIFDEIVGHIQRQGGGPAAWYVGIASDIERRLHVEHNVPKSNHWFITRNAGSEGGARAIEQALLKLGCKGGTGGGGPSTRFVYAYLITYATRE